MQVEKKTTERDPQRMELLDTDFKITKLNMCKDTENTENFGRQHNKDKKNVNYKPDQKGGKKKTHITQELEVGTH